MARIQRRRRVRCKLPCEIVLSPKKRVQGRVVTLSEGGMAVITGLRMDQGDTIRLVIDPNGARPIKVTAIVWNDLPQKSAGGQSRLRRLGCVVSHPSDSFVSLLERLLPPEPTTPKRAAPSPNTDSVPIAVPKKKPEPAAECVEPDLPRSRELQPPPKVEPEDSLPYFRIRLKQIGGPRTRILTVRARSATQAEQRALDELAEITSDAAGWGILHVAKLAGGRR